MGIARVGNNQVGQWNGVTEQDEQQTVKPKPQPDNSDGVKVENQGDAVAGKELIDRANTRQANLNGRLNEAAAPFDYNQIQGVRGNPNVTPEFISGVESMAGRLGAKPEHLMSLMSFETGGTFSPSIRNSIGATGLIQFLPETARALGTSTDNLARLSSTQQLKYVEQYFNSPNLKGKIGTLEGAYTAVLAGNPRTNPNDVLFRQGSAAYRSNAPLDFNRDGNITAGEAVNPVAARMYGGVKAVQQKLLDGGFVPEAQKKDFADGTWGPNTSAALGRFQKANGLPETGLMDDVTGRRLFNQAAPGPNPPPPADGPLGVGSKGPQVEALQDKLVKLGYMTEEQKATGPGIFGPRTEGALKSFQTDIGLPATGKTDAATNKAANDIISSLGRDGQIKNEQVTKAIQDRLVKLNYISRERVNTGYGTFGPQTEAAVKEFQQDNSIAMSGKVGAQTFSALFDKAAKPNGGNGGNNNGGVSTATDGRYYTVNSGILISDALRPKLEDFARRYFEATGSKLHVTSGYRPPARQANAMYDLIVNRGQSHVQNLYANQGAVSEILAAYRANSGSRAAAVNAMTRAIERQVANGTYISNHLRSNAIDVSANSNAATLRSVAGQVGGRVLNEGDHYHIEL